LRKASFLLTPLLGLALLLTLAEPKLGPHLSTRYLQDAVRETGLSPFLAALADYRGFDLLLIALMGWACGLLGLLTSLVAFPQVPWRGKAWAAILLLSGGLLLGSGVGVLTLLGGGNLLDFEPFVRFAPPGEARRLGASCLGMGSLLCGAGAFFSLASSSKEMAHGD
jgi:hypothetical protein